MPIMAICHQPRIICILNYDDLYFALRTFVFTRDARGDRPPAEFWSTHWQLSDSDMDDTYDILIAMVKPTEGNDMNWSQNVERRSFRVWLGHLP